MSEHTPGPWEADIRAYGYEVRPKGEQRECWATIGGKQPLACHEPVLDPNPDTPTPYVPLTNEQIATARLIAAAPDLLAALEAVEWGAEGPDCDHVIFRCPACLQIDRDGHAPDCQLAAALKAAKGE